MTIGKFLSFNAAILSFITLSYLTSCVPARQFDELKKREQDCQAENTKLKSDNQNLNTELTELKVNMEKLSKDINALTVDSTQRGSDLRRLTSLYNELTKSY